MMKRINRIGAFEMKKLILITVFVLALFSTKADLKSTAANLRFDVSFPRV